MGMLLPTPAPNLESTRTKTIRGPLERLRSCSVSTTCRDSEKQQPWLDDKAQGAHKPKAEYVRIGQETDSQDRVSERESDSKCLLTRPVCRCTPGMKARAWSPAWLRDQYHSFTARLMPMAWHFPEAWCSILIEQCASGPPCVYPLVLVPSKLSPDTTGTDD
ncbi:hypothetical protein LB506_008723 [Fusarium annulatum]|nr:hypothetical protein LB506_008723 [Fusarium annulatum]